MSIESAKAHAAEPGKPRLQQSKPHFKPAAADTLSRDSFQNFLAKVGIGTNNLTSGSSYGFNPITRNRLQIEWAYRGSWIVGTIVDCVAEDMTRAGIEIQTDDPPENVERIEKAAKRLQVWSKLQDTIKWARLYGGAIGYVMVDGQDSATPLNLDTVGKGQFKGIYPVDRWALFPSFNDLVEEMGPHLGDPKFYELRPDYGTGLPYMKIHHSRCIRMVGVELPYWQRITENYWGQSVIERLWDRLVAFDSTTQGAAQLVYKAYLRTYAVKGLRKLIAAGGPAYDALTKQLNMISKFQNIEGMTLVDAEDEFQTHAYTFSGLDGVLLQMGQQLSGASQIPLVRLFGQSPAGLNSTGESDLRTYYDGINRGQENELREGAELCYDLLYRSEFGKAPPKSYVLKFRPLWQLKEEDRAQIATSISGAIIEAYEKQIIARSTALAELREASRTIGIWSNITTEMIEEAKKEDNEKPPSPEDLGLMAPQPNEGRSTAEAAARGAVPAENRPNRTQIRAAS